MLIAFMSDFGSKDEYVGVCKLVINRINPLVSVVDISHEIYPFDILTGGWMLYNIISYMPPDSIILPIIDPGVGSERKSIIVETEKRITFVGPDNGLIYPSAERLGITNVWEIIHDKTQHISPTFHGRDIFAPIAAKLSKGMSPLDLNAIPLKTPIKKIDIFGKQLKEDKLTGEVMYIDHFGTIRTNIPFSWLRTILTLKDSRLKVKAADREFILKHYTTFSEAETGETFLLQDSFGWVSLATNKGRADQELKLCPHDTLIIEPF